MMPTNSKEYMRKYYKEHKEKIKKSVTKWRLNNPEKIKAIVKRSNAKQSTKNKKRIWNDKNIEKVRISKSKWDKNNPEKRRIKQMIYAKKYPEKIKAQHKAIKIKKKKMCQICNSNKRLERHHWRYDKPFFISTLCHECHTIQHQKNRRDLLSQKIT